MTNKLQTEHFKIILSSYDKAVRALGYKTAEKGYMQKKVEEFLMFMEKAGIISIKKIKNVDLVRYYDYLRERPNKRSEGTLSRSSISGHFHALNCLYEILLEQGNIEKSIVFPRLIQRDSQQRNILTVDEIKLLFNCCQSQRDRAIISLAYGLGLRRAEIQNLDVKDIQLNLGVLIVREGKGRKRREIPVPRSIIIDLRSYLINERSNYLRQNKEVLNESFLINNKGKRMMGDHINERLKQLIDLSGNDEIKRKGITLHCLRHSIASHLLDNGADIEFVKSFLGHAEIDTVHIYARRRRVKEKMMMQL